MLRTLLAIILGQLTISLLNGICRMAIGFYLDTEISLSGVTHLPSFSWEIIIVGLSLVYGIVGGAVTCLIAKGNYKIEILCLALIIVIIGLFDYNYLNTSEPIWYFLMNTGLIIAGIFLGYRLVLKRNKNFKIQHN